MIQALRLFFINHGYLELETPHLIPSPAPEAHIDAIGVGDMFLHTSPELCMKRLLAAGYSRIFQITKCFRHGERGDRHLPEFTILEWYRTGIDYNALMEESQALILFVSKEMGSGGKIYYQGREIDLACPWEKITVKEAFDSYASLSLEKAIEMGRFDDAMAKEIEPNLGTKRPTFIYDYPALLSSLARLSPDNKKIAERFEIYLAGIELANGFSELNDAQEQRVRFEKELIRRRRLGKRLYKMDEKFLKSLEHMPEAAGIALGVDRLAMIFTDRDKIDGVISFTPEEV